MYRLETNFVDDRYTGRPTNIERVILSKNNKIVDIAEFENGGGPFDWTEGEIIEQMKKRNNIVGELLIAV